jgi:nucleoside-diphosphate-sugar epimerase
MSPTHPDTFYAQTKRAAEQIVLNAKGANGQPLGAVLRLGAVYGSRIKGSHAIGIKPPVTKAIIDKYTEDIAVDGSLIQRELGFVPEYDLVTGWQETIRGRDSFEC